MQIPGFNLIVFLLLVAVPAYLLNKQLLKWFRPRESFARLGMYFIASIAFGMAFAAIGMYVVFVLMGQPKLT